MTELLLVSLLEYDKEEWWDVCHRLRPDATREQFEVWWQEFVAVKTAELRLRVSHTIH